MRYSKLSRWCAAGVVSVAIGYSAPGQTNTAAGGDQGKAGGAAGVADMMEMMKPGENHKLLAKGVGDWTYTVKTWESPDPNAPPSESTGTTVVREVLGGRYFIGEHAGKFEFPGADGKMTTMDFRGISTEGYDNARKKFVSSWIDNMGTGIMYMEGTYDPANHTITYRGEYTPMPGMVTKVRQVTRLTDKDHRTIEFYEDRGGAEVKTMQIDYKRKS